MPGQASFVDPWQFELNPEAYLLVATLSVAYLYIVAVLGRRVVPAATRPVAARQRVAFISAMVALFVASTWPLQQLGEDYLLTARAVQTLILTLVVAPLMWLATPQWMMRVVATGGRLWPLLRAVAKPPVAALVFTATMVLVHLPPVMDAAAGNGPLRVALHVLLLAAALAWWLPVVGPLPALRMGYGARMLYLFVTGLTSSAPTLWWTFADHAVYEHYATQPVRVWGLSALHDQQIAGIVAKAGSGLFLWVTVVVMFARWFNRDANRSYARGGRMPTAEVVGTDDYSLTFADVERAFAQSEPPREPSR